MYTCISEIERETDCLVDIPKYDQYERTSHRQNKPLYVTYTTMCHPLKRAIRIEYHFTSFYSL